MRLIKILGIIALVCIACGIALSVGGAPASRSSGPGAVGAEIGRMLVLLLAAGIPASIGFWFRRKNNLVDYPGLGTGVCVAFFLAVFIGLGNQHRWGETAAKSEAWSVYAPKGCGYEVRFPGNPSVTKQKQYLGGIWLEVERAEYEDRTGYLRAECLMFHLTPVLAETMVKNFIEHEGLRAANVVDVSPSVMETKGTKTVKDETVLVAARVHHGRSATLTLLAATAASTYPTRQISAYFGSVKEIRDRDRPFLMAIVFENQELQQVPITEEACLTRMAQVRDDGPQQMTVTAIGQGGKLTEISGLAQRIHCIAPDGKLMGPKIAK